MNKVILASTSPYRKALLERLMINFDCVPPNVDEDHYKQNISDPYELARVLAEKKAMAISKDNPDAIVIGSDQLAHLNGQVLGKPKTFEKALEQMSLLSGKTHELITAVSICYHGKSTHFTNVTKLKMRSLTLSQMKSYLVKDEPFDCAGSYKLELSGIALFEKIDTSDQTAIIGLPLIETANKLIEFGVQIP